MVGRAGERGLGGVGRLFEAGRLTTFSAFRMGVNSSLGAYSNNYGNSWLEKVSGVWRRHHNWFPRKMATGKRAHNFPCWWRVTNQIWVMLLTGWQLASSIRCTTQIWVVTRHQCGIRRHFAPGNHWWRREMLATFFNQNQPVNTSYFLTNQSKRETSVNLKTLANPPNRLNQLRLWNGLILLKFHHVIYPWDKNKRIWPQQTARENAQNFKIYIL